MKKAIVIGHKCPDTDSVVASLVAADYGKSVLKIDAKAYRAGELNNETKFVLEALKEKAPALVKSLKGNESVILVDHNEKDQAVDGLQVSQLEMIVDHHKIVLATEKPIAIRTEPWGSTSSVLAKMYQEAGKKISSRIAKLLLAGILSDTWNLVSPTSTEVDRKLLSELNKIAKINIKDFFQKMMVAKSSLKGISLDTLISQDYKLFEMGKYKTGIGVWETTGPEAVNEKKEKILELLKAKKAEEKVDYVFFFVVDILKQESFLYIIDEEEKTLAGKVFQGKEKDGLIYLKGIVSRKKQIAPAIEKSLTK